MFTRLVPALAGLLAARWLDPAAFAIVAWSTMIVALWQIVLDLGLTVTLVPAGRGPAERDEHFTIMLLLGALGAVCCTAAGNLLGAMLGQSTLGVVVMVQSLSLPLLAYHEPAISHGIRNLDFSPMFLRQVVPACIMAAATVGLAWNGAGPMSFAVGVTSATLAGAIVIPRSQGWRPALRRPGTVTLNAIRLGREVLVSRLCGFGVAQLDVMILGAGCGPHAVGLWRMATQWLGLPLGLVPPVLQVMSGHMNACKHDVDQLRRLHLRYSIASFVAMAALSLAVVLLSPILVRTFLGVRWTEAIPVIQAAFAVITGPMVMANNELARVLQRNRSYLWFSVCRSVVTVIVLVIAAQISFPAFIYGWAICGMLATGANLWVFFRWCSPFRASRIYICLYGIGAVWTVLLLSLINPPP